MQLGRCRAPHFLFLMGYRRVITGNRTGRRSWKATDNQRHVSSFIGADLEGEYTRFSYCALAMLSRVLFSCAKRTGLH